MFDPLKKYLFISLGIHVAIFLFLFFNPDFDFGWQKETKITWIKLSKGDGGTNKKANFKNSKTLPDATVREQQNALRDLAKDQKGKDLISHSSQTKKIQETKTKISQKKTSDNGGINLNKKTTTLQKTRIDDALARIDQQLEQRQVDLTAAQARKEDTGQSPWGSNEGSDIDPALMVYYNTLKKKINREWIISKGEFSEGLKTKIIVMIDANGNVLRTSYKVASGDGSFDDSALRALKKAAPFPIPPESIRDEALTEGFLIEFNPKAVTGYMSFR